MKRLLCLAIALCLVTVPAFAQPLGEAQPLTDARYYPDGSDAATAGYASTYRLPQFVETDETDKAINAYFSSLAASLADAAPPDGAITAQAADGSPAGYTHLDYRVTCNTDDFLSVLLSSQQFLGSTQTESWTGLVFALDGIYAGKPVTLSQAAGLEAQDDAATGSESYVSQLTYGLVWEIIQQQEAAGNAVYDPDLTLDGLKHAFSPESDFYLDENGNFVFYLQAGAISSEVNGILTFPFSLAELLSAVQ